MASQQLKVTEEKIKLPAGIDAHIDENTVVIKCKGSEVRRVFSVPLVRIKKDTDSIVITARGITRKHKRLLYSALAHLNNMIAGCQQPFVYKLKVCSGHFPITVKKEGDKILISNFLGEKIPRVSPILPHVDVKIDKDIIIVSSPDREAAGQSAANLERATYITKRDRRIFQDGCYITEKPRRTV